jgi:Protein of unknown function (DUF732)
MLKLISLTVISIIAFSAIAPNSAKSQEPDYACYMTTSLHKVIDLSNSLCRRPAPVVQTVASVDSLFLAAYKKAAIAKNPNMQNILLKQPSEINVKYAQAICHGLKSGLSAEQIQTLQTSQINKLTEIQPDVSQAVVDLSAIQLLAPQYYCPQFK